MEQDIILIKQNELSTAEDTHMYDLLSEKERESLDKIRDTSRRQLKLHTHARLRQKAARRLNIRPEELVWQTEEHGKPFFSPQNGLYFSLSYTKDASVLILSDHPVGIDIEKIRSHRMRFSKNLGTPHELSLLRAAPDDLLLFYTFWTRKEAWLKLTGSGLTVPLTTFDVWEEPAASRLFTWQQDDYCISVCM